jgi:LmbE family N-acetylglucosaminyl deacetylase
MPAPGRILILVPHPDDEVVGCAIAAIRARAEGAKLFAFYLTTGVPARAQLWPWARGGHAARVAIRRAEAFAAAELLGIEPTGFQPWPARQLKSHLEEASALVEATLGKYRIDGLWAPAYEGGHQDHDAANLLAAAFKARIPVTEFAEYHNARPAVSSQGFITRNGGERLLRLSEEERQLKRRALALYRSERANLAHVKCEIESLRPLAPYDYAAPPHPGRLFWARFQWVPFRHPRIDFDPPEKVYATLAAFAREIPAPRATPLAEVPAGDCGALPDAP